MYAEYTTCSQHVNGVYTELVNTIEECGQYGVTVTASINPLGSGQDP